ncbi:MAG TPA: hypothetical protein PLL66_04590 [Bacteroidales bacterium]|nr:hypothetical protein [Bacteroidales bacterium]
MKKLLQHIILFLILIVLFACNTNPNGQESNVRPQELNTTLVITLDSMQLFDSLQSNAYSKNAAQDITQSDFGSSVLLNPDNNSNVNNATISIDEKNIYSEIDSLIQLLSYYDMQVFDDCKSVETSVEDFTNRFFIVINDIQTNDSLAIEKLKGLENFLTVFEEDFENVETNCPDLYNDYMEYLDDLIDMHYQKLENIFGEGNAIK